MRIAIAAFSDRGYALGQRLARALCAEGHTVDAARCGAGGPTLGAWTAGCFAGADALLFVGSVGIAVRAVAPHLQGKTVDPAVVAIDEGGRHAVAVLSGHIGGANALTETVARITGAAPVITTATDVAGLFAVDSWAAAMEMVIANPGAIKTVSAKALAGETVRLRSAYPVAGSLPDGWVVDDAAPDVVVDVTPPVTGGLWLIPKTLVLGIGCRKGASATVITGAFGQLCEMHALDPRGFAAVCSIDLKKDEPGLLAFCRALDLPFTVYRADELAAVEGVFTASAFVQEVTGVDTVCERSAVLGSGGRLRAGKMVIDGVTMAVAEKPYRVDFSRWITGGLDE